MSPLVVLDLDGTLVDSVPDLAAALNRLMAARKIMTFSRTDVAAMVGDGAAALVGRAFARRNVTQDGGALAEFLAEYTSHVANESSAYPCVAATLEAMVARGWRLAVCTNKPEVAARTLLEALGLAGFFAAVGGGDSFPTRKPDPAHLLATIAAAGGDPRLAIMVGDHHNDIIAAHGAGVPCIFAAWGYGPVSAGADAAAVAACFAAVPTLAEPLFSATR